MLTRLLLGALATFLLVWAVGWWAQGKDGVSVTITDDLAEERVSTRELTGAAALLSRYGLSAIMGAIGLLVAWIAARGPDQTEWAQRSVWAILLLGLAGICAWGCSWSWRGFRAQRLPEAEESDYVETALGEGRCSATRLCLRPSRQASWDRRRTTSSSPRWRSSSDFSCSGRSPGCSPESST